MRSCPTSLFSGALAITSLTLAFAEPIEAQPTRTVPAGELVFDEGFSMLSEMAELAGGKLVLLDDVGDRLLLGDPRSGVVSEFVRKGSGPREIGYPVRILALADGGAVAVDAENERFLIVGPDGEVGDFFRLGRDGEPSRVARRVSGYPVANGDIIYEAIDERGREIVRWSAKEDRVTRLAPRTPREHETVVMGGVVEVAAGTPGVPSRALPTSPDEWTASVDGYVAIVFQEPYRVTVIANDGTRVDGAPVAIERLPVSSETRAARVRELAIQRGRQASPDGEYLWPETLPAFHTDRFQSLFFAPNGEIWVRRTVPGGRPPSFDVFTRQAVLSKRVELPMGARLLGFGDGAVYLVRRDADDLEYVYRAPFAF